MKPNKTQQAAIKAAMTTNKITQAALAKMAGVGEATVSRFLHGRAPRHCKRKPALWRVLDALGLEDLK